MQRGSLHPPQSLEPPFHLWHQLPGHPEIQTLSHVSKGPSLGRFACFLIFIFVFWNLPTQFESEHGWKNDNGTKGSIQHQQKQLMKQKFLSKYKPPLLLRFG